MSNPAPALTLSEAERPVLEALSKSQVAAHREVQRAAGRRMEALEWIIIALIAVELVVSAVTALSHG